MTHKIIKKKSELTQFYHKNNGFIVSVLTKQRQMTTY